MSVSAVCVKIGGRVATDESALSFFAEELRELRDDFVFILIHGGGAEVSRVSKMLDLCPEFVDGVRMTSEEEMAVVDMVLAGKINKHLVRFLYQKGLQPVGISGADGGLIIGEPIDDNTRTGKPTDVNPRLILHLLDADMLPVISPVAMDGEGVALNINADDVALALAASIPAKTLIFISDIPGILRDGTVISNLTPEEAEEEILGGVISGGMIPKVRAAAEALSNGVSKVVIGGYDKPGDLYLLLSGQSGTTMYRRNDNCE